MIRHVGVVVIGGGHSGLAMSHALGQRGIEQVVLDRGEVANGWRTERRDSLRLLTPNWMTRLPGFSYRGDDPDGYTCVGEVVNFISGFATYTSAPVHRGDPRRAEWRRLSSCDQSWRLAVPRRRPRDRCLQQANRAAPGRGHASRVVQLTAQTYRNPEQLAEGGVLVVGGSATGLQLAQEIHRSGRPVTLTVGEHGCRASIEVGTSSGGCSRRACLTSAARKLMSPSVPPSTSMSFEDRALRS